MQLSKINKDELTDDDIQKIVYDNTYDSGKTCTYGLVFGNSMLINERVNTAVESYKKIE